jgi:hypothetical protein
MYNIFNLRKEKTMKKAALYILFVCLFVYPTCATHYEITTNIYTPSLTLQTGDSLYMTNGGFDTLTLFGTSTAIIEGTSALEEFSGGVWYLSLANNSHLDMSGGQVNLLAMNNYATAELHGGLIQQIWSYQYVPYIGGHGQPAVPNPNIKLYYSGDLPTLDSSNVLTGLWGNGDPFSIYLHNVTGYDPVIENIQFILVPEPGTLLLLGLGGLLIRRKI